MTKIEQLREAQAEFRAKVSEITGIKNPIKSFRVTSAMLKWVVKQVIAEKKSKAELKKLKLQE
jgi:hypothetical protein